MKSKDGEIINFSTPFVAEGAVENWLCGVEYKMRLTL